MANTIGVAVQVTADAGGFRKSIDDVSASLVKTQEQALRAAQETRDAFGVLRDGQGRIVEGLAKWQKKLGYYVDDLGRVRTANDRFVDGLTTLQKKIGLEVDEVGNLYDAAGKVVGSLGKSADEADRQSKPAFDSLHGQLEKIRRDALTAADGFSRLKDGLDVLLGQGNPLSKFVDSVGKLARSTTALSQIRDQFKMIREQLDALKDAKNDLGSLGGKGGKGVPSLVGGLKNLGKVASAAKVALAGLTTTAALALAAVAAFAAGLYVLYKLDEKRKWRAFESLDPAIKGLEQYKEKAEELAKAADAAREKLRSMNDALRFGALKQPRANGKSDVETLIDTLRENERTGLSASQRALAEAGIGVFGKTELGRQTDLATLKAMDALGLRGGAKNNSKEEREEIYAALNEYVAALKEQTKEEESASTRLANQIKDLDAILSTVEAGSKEQKDLEELRATLEKQRQEAAEAEAAAARQAARSAAGIESFINSNKDAEVTVENYRSKLDEWSKLVEQGTVSSEELNEASTNAAASIRGKLLSKFGVVLPSGVDDVLTAFQEMKAALDAGVVSQDDYNATISQIQRRNAERLAQEAGVVLEEPPKFADVASFQKELDIQLSNSKITLEDYNRLLNGYKKNAADSLAAQQATAANALAAAQGLDLDAAKKANAATKSFEEQLEEWRRAANEGKVSAEDLSRAEASLRLAINDREEKARKEAEEAAAKAREQAFADTGLDDLKSQAQELADTTKTWKEKLDETMKKADEAFMEGTLTLEDLNEAQANYAKVVAAKTEEEKKAAKENVRSSLGVDALMESLKSPAQKLSETITSLNEALVDSYINSDEYTALRNKAVEEYRNAVSDFKQEEEPEPPKSERMAAGTSFSNSTDFYKAFIAQMSPRSYEKKIEDTTSRIYDVQSDTYRAQLETNEWLAQLAAAPSFEVFG